MQVAVERVGGRNHHQPLIAGLIAVQGEPPEEADGIIAGQMM
jgi:hypothetical protein